MVDKALFIDQTIIASKEYVAALVATIPEGPTGPAGATGLPGPAGATGPQGLTGPTGPAGATGATGATGADGTGVTILGQYNTEAELIAAHPTGSPGDSYLVGGDLYVWSASPPGWENVGNIQGPQGPAGTTGATGPAGPTGPQGATGPAGTQGATGATGATGSTGPAGPIGLTGPAGATGAMGLTGPVGPMGPAGESGTQGDIGPQGDQGPIGATGSPGPAGATGATGPQGPAGTIASMAGQRILGRDPVSSGAPLELQVSGGLEFATGSIRRGALTGDVAAAAGSGVTNIAPRAVTTDKMAALPEGNYIINPNFTLVTSGAAESASSHGWGSLPAGWAIVARDGAAAPLSSSPARFALKMLGNAASLQVDSNSGLYTECRPNETFYVGAQVVASGSVTTNTLRLSAFYLLADGTNTFTISYVNPTTSWATYNFTITTPATACGIKLRITRAANTDASDIYLTSFYLERYVTAARLPAGSAIMKPSGGAAPREGLAPDPGAVAGIVKYLREDATWAVPTGSGSGVTNAYGTITADSGTANSSGSDTLKFQSDGSITSTAADGSPDTITLSVSSTITAAITANATAIGLKADKTYVDAQDLLKADKTYVDTQDALKASIAYVDAQDALKADKTYVDARTLDDLSDVTITTPVIGSMLRYDGATTKWVDGSGVVDTATAERITLTDSSLTLGSTGTFTLLNRATDQYLWMSGGSTTATGASVLLYGQGHANAARGELVANNERQLSFDPTTKLTSLVPHKFPDGSATAPGIAWTGATNTGFWRSAATTIDVVTAGVSRFKVSSTDVTSTLPITLPSALPTVDYHAASKKYVDQKIAVFDLNADVTAATIASAVDAIWVAGHTTVGVGAAIFKRTGSAGTVVPSHPGKLTSNGGTINWELATDFVTPDMLGASTNLANDSTAAVQAAFDVSEALSRPVYFPRLYKLMSLVSITYTGNDRGISIYGNNRQSCGYRCFGVGAGLKITFVGNRSGCDIHHLSIQPFADAVSCGLEIIGASGSASDVLREVHHLDFAQTGSGTGGYFSTALRMIAVRSPMVHDCQVFGGKGKGYAALHFQDCPYIECWNHQMTQEFQIGIFIDDGIIDPTVSLEGPQIEDCVINTCDKGIVIRRDNGENRAGSGIKNVGINAMLRGIQIDGAQLNEIENAWIYMTPFNTTCVTYERAGSTVTLRYKNKIDATQTREHFLKVGDRIQIRTRTGGNIGAYGNAAIGGDHNQIFTILAGSFTTNSFTVTSTGSGTISEGLVDEYFSDRDIVDIDLLNCSRTRITKAQLSRGESWKHRSVKCVPGGTETPLIWASGTSYAVGDIVKNTVNGNVYRCRVAYSGTTAPAEGATWALQQVHDIDMQLLSVATTEVSPVLIGAEAEYINVRLPPIQDTNYGPICREPVENHGEETYVGQEPWTQRNTTAVSNTGSASLTDLMTISVPPYSLYPRGKALEIEAWGKFLNTADAKSVQLFFGGAAQDMTTEVSLPVSAAGDWRIVGRVTSRGDNQQSFWASVEVTGQPTTFHTLLGNEVDTAAIIARVKTRCAVAGKVTQEYFVVKHPG